MNDPRRGAERAHRRPARMILPVMEARAYHVRFPEFKQPLEVGHFSVDGNRHYCPDRRNLKYLTRSELHRGPVIDLNKGFETAVFRNRVNDEAIVFLLRHIKDNIHVIRTAMPPKTPTQIFGADFVCFRGLLTKICSSLYETNEGWIISATKFRGTIYLCGVPTENEMNRTAKATDKEKLMCYWGYKFEQYMLSDSPEKEPDATAIVNENEEYCVTVKGTLMGKKLLFGAEIDGIDPNITRNGHFTDCYVELKTSRVISTPYQNYIFHRYKARKFWIQSFLIGIPKVTVGFRDENGVVQNLQTFTTRDLAKMGEGSWSAASMMNFLDVVLTFIKNFVTQDDPRLVYKFSWNPGHDVEGVGPTSASEKPILPEWFIAHFT